MDKEDFWTMCNNLEKIQWNTSDISHKRAIYIARKALEIVGEYVENHGDLALDCGSEWLYQSDSGLEDAPDVVAKILDLIVEMGQKY